MKDRLLSAISEIRNNKSIIISDEASIKSGVLLRLLSILGWNPFDVNEVKPEYSVESKRVDFSLRINSTNKVFIEVKRPNENLEAHQEQLLNYSFREGVKQGGGAALKENPSVESTDDLKKARIRRSLSMARWPKGPGSAGKSYPKSRKAIRRSSWARTLWSFQLLGSRPTG